jgi:hypothetical protein
MEFSTRDPVHKGLRTINLDQLFRSPASHPRRRSKATPTSTIRRDETAPIRRPYSLACQLQSIGRCRGLHNPSTSPPWGGGSVATLQAEPMRPQRSFLGFYLGRNKMQRRSHHRTISQEHQRRYFSMGPPKYHVTQPKL